MPSVEVVITEYVCPTFAAILSTVTFGAPIKSLKSAIENGSLGSLNPTPWAFMTGNTIGWLAYSYITLDLFVFFANAPGLMFSIWLNIGAMKLQYHEELAKYSSIQLTEGQAGERTEEDNRNEAQPTLGENEHNNGGDTAVCQPHMKSLTSHEFKVLQILVIWLVILSTTSLLPINTDERKFVIGVAVNLNLIFFYAAPLSTILTVIRTKSSASIHVCTMVMNTFNAFFWCTYSLAIQDYYILIPNGLGFLFGLIQISLFKIYRQSEIIHDNVTEHFLDDDAGKSKANSGETQSEII